MEGGDGKLSYMYRGKEVQVLQTPTAGCFLCPPLATTCYLKGQNKQGRGYRDS